MIQKNGFASLLLLLLLLVPLSSSHAALWGGSELVTINGTEFTPEDYRNWWREWREPKMTLQETPEEFIDWMLLSQEARDMQLQDNAKYRQKVKVFLKVRTLMQLKSEEIDSRKVIADRDQLWSMYLERFTPILNLRLLALADEEQAGVVEGFLAQGIALDKVADAAGIEQLAEQLEATGPMRYTRIPEPLQVVAVPMKAGEIAGPVKFGHSWYFIEVLERNDGTEEDFESVKQALIYDDLKTQEYKLTHDMVEQLKIDYEVQIYDEVIAAIEPGEISDELAKKIAVKIGETDVPAKIIFAAANKAQSTRGHARKDPEDFSKSKTRVVNDLLVQTLTSREALSRHYEKVPPLQQTYEFYSQHRLIKELDVTILKPQVKITDADIEAYYKENPNKYSREGMVELAIVRTNEQQLAKTLNQRLKDGEDFFTVMEPISPAGIQIKKTPLQHLTPLVQAEVAKLAAGQAAGGIEDGADILFIKLVRKGEREFVPIEKVKGQIRTQLEADRFQQLKSDMVQQLRERSSIKLNKSAWKKLKKALQEEEPS